MINKPSLHGVRIYKTFREFVQDLSKTMEKDHHMVHNMNKLKTRELINKTTRV